MPLNPNPWAACLLLLISGLQADNHSPSELNVHQQRAEDILDELVRFESIAAKPDQTLAALQAMAARLRAAGFSEDEINLITPVEGHHGLVVRYRGIGDQRPLLTLSHIDVVPATPESWSFPPFTLGKRDGYYLGRGTTDNKTGVTQLVSNFIRLKQEGWTPNRDVIAVLSGDEETDGLVARWLANDGRSLVDAAYALNTDAGGGELNRDGSPRAFWVQTSEKLYQTYELTARNDGGHSSLPRPDNAINDLALAITRLADYQFPVLTNDSTRLELTRSAEFYQGEISEAMHALARDRHDSAAAQTLAAYSPLLNAKLRTTCVSTMLRGGHAENALPRDATVTVNCRIFPGTEAQEVEGTISRLINGLEIDVKVVFDGFSSEPSIIPAALMESIENMIELRWGEIPLIPQMSAGATDGLFFRNAGIPVYGVGACFAKPPDRSHGLNERMGIGEFHECVEFWYDLLKVLAD